MTKSKKLNKKQQEVFDLLSQGKTIEWVADKYKQSEEIIIRNVTTMIPKLTFAQKQKIKNVIPNNDIDSGLLSVDYYKRQLQEAKNNFTKLKGSKVVAGTQNAVYISCDIERHRTEVKLYAEFLTVLESVSGK